MKLFHGGSFENSEQKINQRALNVQFSTVPLSSNQLHVCESYLSPVHVILSFKNIPADIYRLYCIIAKYLKSGLFYLRPV